MGRSRLGQRAAAVALSAVRFGAERHRSGPVRQMGVGVGAGPRPSVERTRAECAAAAPHSRLRGHGRQWSRTARTRRAARGPREYSRGYSRGVLSGTRSYWARPELPARTRRAAVHTPARVRSPRTPVGVLFRTKGLPRVRHRAKPRLPPKAAQQRLRILHAPHKNCRPLRHTLAVPPASAGPTWPCNPTAAAT
jgi:hypothetical protein